MVCNSPCSVCFLTQNSPASWNRFFGGLSCFDWLFSSFLTCFYQIFQNKLEKQTFSRPISVLIIFLFLFCFALLIFFKGGFLIALTFCSRPIFLWLFSNIRNVGCQKISQDNLIIFVVSLTASIDSLESLRQRLKIM